MTSEIRPGSRMSLIGFDLFTKAYLTIGQATDPKLNITAKIPAYLIKLLFSERLMAEHLELTGKNTYISSAQLVSNHTIEDLNGAQLLCNINFPRKQIGKIMSDCLVTGVQREGLDAIEKRETTVFMKPSTLVPLGSRVGILGSEEILESNPRNLNWPEFSAIDLRIGTVVGLEVNDRAFRDSLVKVTYTVDFGEVGRIFCVGVFHPKFKIATLISKQILVLTNLDRKELKGLFAFASDADVSGAILTVAGMAAIIPAKPVLDGFRLA